MLMVEPGPETTNRIEELWNDHRDLIAYLQSGNQLQLSSRVEDAFSKTLIVAAASYFEVRLTQIIIDLYIEMTQGAEVLVLFVKRQAIGRRFAQLFNWGDEAQSSQNANSFYNLFGSDFSDYMKKKIQNDRDLDASVKAFLEIGNIRNQMMHDNYADFQLNKTVEDVYSLYKTAIKFLNDFPVAIRECTTHGKL